MNIVIVLLMITLILLAFSVVAIRRVRILDRELKEAQREISEQISKGETKIQN